MTTIHDVFDLPSREEIGAQSFVVKLDALKDPDARRKMVDDYVLTPAVREQLPLLFDALRHANDRHGHLDVGRFVHGSFGSGKSHFLTLLALLFENDGAAWKKVTDAVPALAAHRSWIVDARILPVRVHMLTADRPTLDLVLLGEANRELRERGKAELVRIDVEAIIKNAFAMAERYGDAFFRDLHQRGVVESKAELEALAKGTEKEREELARLLASEAGVTAAASSEPENWAAALMRLSAHVKAQGFGALVFLVDELLLWLSEKEAHEFKRAINQLTAIVDHADGARAVPVTVFVARQRALQEFFPDMTQDQELIEHLDHQSKRFDKIELEDVELRYVCKERVLRRKDPAAVTAAIDRVVKERAEAVRASLQTADVSYLRDVYPFHPALIEAVIDISALLQKERTALRLLYELLVVHHPDLPLGELLPVGSAFEAIVPKVGIEGTKRVIELRKIHHLYWERFRPAIAHMRAAEGLAEADARVLDQLVKTALLSEISPRLRGPGGMTIERLVRLNEVDVPGELDRGRMNLAREKLIALSQKVPVLKLAGEGKTTVVTVDVSGADLSEYLDRARAATRGVEPKRFAVFYRALKKALDLNDVNGFGDGEANDGHKRFVWRGTRRSARVRFANVRELRNADLKHGDADALIVIDYPWDATGYGVDHDKQKVQDARHREGVSHTACWLPRHFAPVELAVLEDLAAVEHLVATAEQLLANLGSADKQTVLEQAQLLRTQLEKRLGEILADVYKNHGQIAAMAKDVGERPPKLDANLDGILEALVFDLLDRRWPQHPRFEGAKEVKEAELQMLCEWLVEASAGGGENHPYDAATQGRLLKQLGGPLEVLELGETKGRLRRDTRYIKAVADRARDARVTWDTIDGMLETDFGFVGLFRTFFLAYFARAWGYRVLTERGEVVEPKVSAKTTQRLTLERAPLLEVAEWTRVRDLLAKLSNTTIDAHRSISAQDALLKEAQEKLGTERRAVLRTAREKLAALDAQDTERARQIDDAMKRLAPLAKTSTDSCDVLRQLLALWPDDVTDPVREATRSVETVKRGLDLVDNSVRMILKRANAHPELGLRVVALLDELHALVGAGASVALAPAAVESWNQRARRLAEELVAHPPPPPPPPPQPPAPPPQPPPPGEETVVLVADQAIDLDSTDALDRFLASLRAKMSGVGGTGSAVTVTIKKRRG